MADNPELTWNIWQAVARAVVALKLPEIGDHVYLQMAADPTAGYSVVLGQTVDPVYPCVLIALDTEAEERGPADNETKGWVYPARVIIADHNPTKLHHRLPIYLRARKALLDLFDERTLEGVPEVVRVLMIPGAQFDKNLPVYQYLISAFTMRVETEEVR